MSLEHNLVFGANSFLGTELIKVLKEQNRNVVGTTRRKSAVSDNCVYLDLSEDDLNFNISQSVNYTYLLAGIWNYGECETDPNAWKVNVVNMARFAKQLLEQGVFVTFISTNTVFGGERPWCHEDDEHKPLFPYAQHKSAAEAAIQAVAKEFDVIDKLNIVRLTKILGIRTAPLPSWIDTMERGDVLRPFADLSFAPTSVRYTAESLAEIGRHHIPGNFHVSGADNVSYDEFSRKFADSLGFKTIEIEPTTSVMMNVNIPFKPRYSGIGMERTTKLIGLKPQTLDELMVDLAAQYQLLKTESSSV